MSEAQQLASIAWSSSSVRDAICTRIRTLLHRCVVSFGAALLKVFIGGFCWQVLAFIAQEVGQQSSSVVFSLFTGVGDAVGSGIGACLYAISDQYLLRGLRSRLLLKAECPGITILCVAAFCSGFTWQPIVNASIYLLLPFSGAMLLTGLGCGAGFFAGMVLARCVIAQVCSRISMLRDLTLALAVFGATAVFVATVTPYRDTPNTWLQAILGEHSSSNATSFLVNCSKAGLSTFLGFLAMQLPLCAVIPSGYLWTDPWPVQEVPPGLSFQQQHPVRQISVESASSTLSSWLLQPAASESLLSVLSAAPANQASLKH